MYAIEKLNGCERNESGDANNECVEILLSLDCQRGALNMIFPLLNDS